MPDQEIKSSQKAKNKKCLVITILFLVVFSLTTVCFFYCYQRKESEWHKFHEKYPLLSPERGFYNQKDLIVNIQPLRDEFDAIGKDRGVSIYFEFLNTGANIAVNKEVKIWPASLMKIPIAMAVMKKVENKKWELNKSFILEEKDKNSIFGLLYKKPAGSTFSLEELLGEMLINSDNTARNIFARNLSSEDIDDVLDHLGIEYDYKNDEKISAKKYSIFWRSLFTSSYLAPENSSKLIEIMSQSSAAQYLAQGISDKQIKFSHKIGVLYDENTYADSGIVFISNRPYILTVMVDGHSQSEAGAIMKEISEKAYRYVSEYK